MFIVNSAKNGAVNKIPKNSGRVMNFYRRPLPSPPAIPFSSPEGKEIFREAMDQGYMEGYFRLAEQFVTQMEPAFCGLASLAMVLNTLEIDPRRTWKGNWRWFDEKMLDCCEPLEKVSEYGIEFHKLAALAACNGAAVQPYHVHPAIPPSQDFQPPERPDTPELPHATLARFRRDLEAACKGDGSQVLVSYSRKPFLQTGDGHFSPIGGYHREKDLLLIMDVARFKYPPHWVKVDMLWEAMRYMDKTTGLPRGYMKFRTAANGRGVLFTLSTQRTLWDRQLSFFLKEGIRDTLKQTKQEAGTDTQEWSSEEVVIRELEAVVRGRLGPSVAVLSVRPQEHIPDARQIRQQVVEQLRALPLRQAVQEALLRIAEKDKESDPDGKKIAEYDDALSLCGMEGLADGLWVREEEEALLLTMLLLASPDDQWQQASPDLQAMRLIGNLPEVLTQEVATLRSQLDALARFGCMCGIEVEHDCHRPEAVGDVGGLLQCVDLGGCCSRNAFPTHNSQSSIPMAVPSARSISSSIEGKLSTSAPTLSSGMRGS